MDDAESKSMPIAIIGMSCKFAGDATNPEKLWKMLEEGRSAWSKIPPSRFNLEGWYHPRHDNISTVTQCPFPGNSRIYVWKNQPADEVR